MKNANYKDAFNAATTEIRQSKEAMTNNITNDSKSFVCIAYFRNKQSVQDKVEPLGDSARNTISQGRLMAENLNV